MKLNVEDKLVYLQFFHEYEHKNDPSPSFTMCKVVLPNGKVLTGRAVLHPRDNYCRDTGRKIALSRALRPLGKFARRLIWDAYFRYRGKDSRVSSEPLPEGRFLPEPPHMPVERGRNGFYDFFRKLLWT